jgi:hypothetical protein
MSVSFQIATTHQNAGRKKKKGQGWIKRQGVVTGCGSGTLAN